MKQKTITATLLTIFFSLFGYFFGEEYWSHQDIQLAEKVFQEQIIAQEVDFSLEELQEISEEVELFMTPNLGLLDMLVQQMDNAQKQIYVEMYIFTERDMRDALIRAHKRGVDIKILLENNPYKAPYLNDKHYAAFEEVGIDVRWSDPLNYSLNHSKLLIIDDMVYVSTGNFSYSLFKYNRDFLVQLRGNEIVTKLQELFLSDFRHEKVGVFYPNLVISPDYSRKKLELLIQNAHTSIDFYFPYMADESFKKVLLQALTRGVELRGVVEKKFYENEDNAKILSEFQEKGGEIHALQKKKLHGKAILVDQKYLYIGSINFSRYSFDENREIGLILKRTGIIEKFQSIFETDF